MLTQNKCVCVCGGGGGINGYGMVEKRSDRASWTYSRSTNCHHYHQLSLYFVVGLLFSSQPLGTADLEIKVATAENFSLSSVKWVRT